MVTMGSRVGGSTVAGSGAFGATGRIGARLGRWAAGAAAGLLAALAVVAPAAAQSDKVFSLAYSGTFPDFDPSTAYLNEPAVLGNVYELLTWYQAGVNGEPSKVVPGLATRWEHSDDGLTWTFHLRDGVTFHDGTPFDSKAVKYSIERTKKIGGGAAFIWGPVKEIETPDPLTVVMRLAYPQAMDVIASSAYGSWMISPGAEGKDAAWFNAGNDAGTGPYRMTENAPGQRVVLRKFDGYWGGWQDGSFDTVVYEIVEDPTLRTQKIMAGEVDWTMDLPVDNIDGLRSDPDITVVASPGYQTLFGHINLTRPPLDDVRVRRAISYAFPYGDYIQGVLGGYGAQAFGIIPDQMEGFDPMAPQYSYDLDKAKALLAEAGHPDGGFTLTLAYHAGYTQLDQLAQLWKASLAKIGVTLEPKPMQGEAHYAAARGKPEDAQDLSLTTWWPTFVTPYDFLYNLFHSEQKPLFNFSYYKNPEYDQLIDNADAMWFGDRAKAIEDFRKAQDILIDQAIAVFIANPETIHALKSGIEGYRDNPAYAHLVDVHALTEK